MMGRKETAQIMLHAQGIVLTVGHEDDDDWCTWENINKSADDMAAILANDADDAEDSADSVNNLEAAAFVLSLVANKLREKTGDQHDNGLAAQIYIDRSDEQ